MQIYSVLILSLWSTTSAAQRPGTTFASIPKRDFLTATPALNSIPTPNPLDYGPDFSKDPAPPFPPVHNEDGSNITVNAWRGTRLFGWNGCGTHEINTITQTYSDFHKIADNPLLYDNLDWTDARVLEFFGHATDPRKKITDARKAQIKQTFYNVQQVYSKWWFLDPPYPPYSWKYNWINVQPLMEMSQITVETAGLVTRDARMEVLRRGEEIIFCDYFFNELKPLDEVMKDAKEKSDEYRNDLWNYQNQARVFFHEVTHLDYFVDAPKKVPYITDLKIQWKIGNKEKNALAYGPENVRRLAKYEAVDLGGFFTMRNADTYAWLAMARYAEKVFGIFPTEPQPKKKPIRQPTDGNGRRFPELNIQDDILATDSTTTTDDPSNGHFIPGCSDRFIFNYATGVTSLGSHQPQCANIGELSGAPYNLFHNYTANIFDRYCFDLNSSAPSNWTVNIHGNIVQQTGLEKRTPPPNPEAYSNIDFSLSWAPVVANLGCVQSYMSCAQVFSDIANSPCGHQGDEQNILTRSSSFDIPGCGIYNLTISGNSNPPPPPPPPQPPAPALTDQWCYDRNAFGKHGDISASQQAASAKTTCQNAAGHMVKNGDPDSNIHWQSDGLIDVPYVYDVYWEPNCQSTVDQMDAGNPLPGNSDATCVNLLTNDYLNCNNGGIGGKRSVGCLTYRFKASFDQQ